jgi:hypothetical protein
VVSKTRTLHLYGRETITDWSIISARTRIIFKCERCGRIENTMGRYFKKDPRLICRECKRLESRFGITECESGGGE